MNTPQGPQPYRHNQPPPHHRSIGNRPRRRPSTAIRTSRRLRSSTAPARRRRSNNTGRLRHRNTASRLRPNIPVNSPTRTDRPATASW